MIQAIKRYRELHPGTGLKEAKDILPRVRIPRGHQESRRDMDWRKSSYSGANGGQCVEVAAASAVIVRDTADRDGTALAFTLGAWQEFTGKLK